jgi:hypothetical protein
LKNFFEEIPPDIYNSETKETFFPLLLIVQILEYFSNEQSFDVDWVIEFLRKTVNVSYFDLYITYKIMFDHYFGSSDEIFDSSFEIPKDNKFRIFKAISILMHRWIEYVGSPNASFSEKKEFPKNDIDSILNHFQSKLGSFKENSEIKFIRDTLQKSINLLE